jgi:hypothetical protein
MADPFDGFNGTPGSTAEAGMNEDDPDRNDALCAEIWRVLLERDKARNALMKSGPTTR